jgi:2-amino-4-hydroxy-6-hydroxymethyldihydropteridine diphosphokinase
VILIALGANLPGPAGTPRETLDAAIRALEAVGVEVVARSRWYRSTPVPKSDQPDFINGVIQVKTDRSPEVLLATLHAIEERLGRVRSVPNAARCLDLDLIDHDGLVMAGPPILPHPRAGERLFVLLPIADLAPDWRLPGVGTPLADLVAACAPDPGLAPLDDRLS